MEPTSTQPKKTAHDPTKVSQSLAIALVVSAVFLLAALSITAWLLLKDNGPVANTVQDPDAVTKNVKNVSIGAPATLPAEYKKNDQSSLAITRVYYYDNAANCGFTVIVSPLVANKSAQETLFWDTESSQAPGVTTALGEQGDKVNLKDPGKDTSYAFDSVVLKQSVNVPGVPYSNFEGTALYKQFGKKVAAVVYGCQDTQWSARKDSMAAMAAEFTVTTER